MSTTLEALKAGTLVWVLEGTEKFIIKFNIVTLTFHPGKCHLERSIITWREINITESFR